MAVSDRTRIQRGPIYPRIESGKLLSPMEVAAAIENFRTTVEGTLRTVRGPTPYLPRYEAAPPGPQDTDTGVLGMDRYGTMHGIFHGLLNRGQREVLLLHVANELWTFEGWNKGWRALISPTDSAAQIKADIVNDFRVRAPTQFVATPNGVVIIFQGDADVRPHFYDGEVILPLGYSSIPGSPSIEGPDTAGEGSNNSARTNLAGKSIQYESMNMGFKMDTPSGGAVSVPTWHDKWGVGRIGTITTMPDVDDDPYYTAMGGHTSEASANPMNAPTLMDGTWQGAIQWIDYFGNLSPISNRSEVVTLDQRSTRWDYTSGIPRPCPGNTLRHQFIWNSIEPGPKGTIGRMLYRTKDMTNSGTVKLYEVPSGSTGLGSSTSYDIVSSAQFASIPDNSCSRFCDNISDTALVSPSFDIRTVPDFLVGRIALGRLFVGNTRANPGAIYYSLPGRWGTFASDAVLYPDPSGKAITGLWRVEGGLIAFTESSTYLITPSDDGIAFRSFPISTTVGCVAPDSIAQLSSGVVIWLGHKGFYAFDGQQIQLVSDTIQDEVKTFNKSRLVQATAAVSTSNEEYICWLPTDDNVYNNRGYVFDGNGWKIRTGANYVALCSTADHREYVLGCGKVEGEFPQKIIDSSLGEESDYLDSGGAYSNSDETLANSATSADEPPGYWGVWVLDRESRHFYPKAKFREPIFETSWLGIGETKRKTPLTLKLWFRETSTTEKVKVTVYRDWRKDEEVSSFTVDLDSPEDPAPAWGVVTNEDEEKWQKRRPFWIKKDIYIPSCEVFKIEIRGIPQKETIKVQGQDGVYKETFFSSCDLEFVALSIDEVSRPSTSRMPRSG